MADDALISLRYARRFLDGRGLTWNDGEWVEGYSNLGWILLTSLLGRTGLDLILVVRILGVTSCVAAVAAVEKAPRITQGDQRVVGHEREKGACVHEQRGGGQRDQQEGFPRDFLR
jgi:hypothetical protein